MQTPVPEPEPEIEEEEEESEEESEEDDNGNINIVNPTNGDESPDGHPVASNVSSPDPHSR